jgi:hypothetical protein
MFNHFSSSYQQLQPSENSNQPFVYVDPNGLVKFLTSVVEDSDQNSDIFAVSVAEDGFMEFLALQES